MRGSHRVGWICPKCKRWTNRNPCELVEKREKKYYKKGGIWKETIVDVYCHYDHPDPPFERMFNPLFDTFGNI